MDKDTKQVLRSHTLKDSVNRFAVLGLVISILGIFIATLLVSLQMTGGISFQGIVLAQTTNPAIWALDLSPLLFAYWGQSFFYMLTNEAESIIQNKTKELINKSGELESKLQFRSSHDSLTSLPNNSLLRERIKQGISQLANHEHLAIIIINIKNFKDINYSIGSHNANTILVQFAERLKSLLLEPYLLQTHMGMNMVARLQGAQFAILIPRLREEHQLKEILSHLIHATSMTIMTHGSNVNITASAGAAIYPQHATDEASLIDNANISLQHAEKEQIPYAIFHHSLQTSLTTNLIMLNELKHAIDTAAYEVFYIPCLRLKDKKIVGGEAIVRFENFKLGFMNSEKLIPLIEGTSLAKKLVLSTLESVLTKLCPLISDDEVFIRLDLSVLDLTDPELNSAIQNLLDKYKINNNIIKFELSEKACLSNQNASQNLINQLHIMGLSIGIRDFCSGYSSFIYLSNYPISEVKIDSSFINSMMADSKKQRLVNGMIKLSESMQIQTIADGIENEQTLDALLNMNCQFGQGPLFSNGLSTSNFLNTLKIQPHHNPQHDTGTSL